MPDTATINLFQSIPLSLSAVRKDNGEPIPEAKISNVVWHMDSNIGQITAGESSDVALFTPYRTGVVHISATATVTIP